MHTILVMPHTPGTFSEPNLSGIGLADSLNGGSVECLFKPIKGYQGQKDNGLFYN